MLNAEAASGAIQSPYLRNVNVQWDRIDQSDLATMHFSEADRRRCELRTGDVLVCEGGEVGRSAVWNGEVQDCYFQKAIHRARPRTNANGRFLMYCLRAAAKMNVFAVEGNQSTIVHLTGEQLSAHRFPWPPPDEQQGIVYRLDTDKADTEATRKKLMDQVDLLSERRQALITAAVTGDLEIPGVAA
jgi:type I restriction enzyme S subunit